MTTLSIPTLVLLCSTPGVILANWDPAPLTVHEWGVNTFDWNAAIHLTQELPKFLYTDQNPGEAVANPAKRVRDLPADSGIRSKPILCFYPERDDHFGRNGGLAEVGVEMRFSSGYANAWWPQVNHYFAEEDGRMQLVWDHLALSPTLLEGQKLSGADLPDDHWVKVAREVDAHYVSNGGEVERYVFYEGKTRETPAIAFLPADGGASAFRHDRAEKGQKDIAIINVGKHPIYDVMAVYRDQENGILWTGHIPMLPALLEGHPKVDQVMALRVPDFSNPDEAGEDIPFEAEEFDRLTRELLIRNLTSGYHFDPGWVTVRDPAEAQPPTQMHQLYEKEAIALEKIWHDDFFEAEGLTVLYRESPAYLDEAMPLNIFTSMYWYVKLSRCGLVLNRNIPIDQVHSCDAALKQFSIALFNQVEADVVAKTNAELKKNRFLTLGQARYFYGRKESAAAWNSPLMEKVEELFDSSD